jgi:hypothetical protein
MSKLVKKEYYEECLKEKRTLVDVLSCDPPLDKYMDFESPKLVDS